MINDTLLSYIYSSVSAEPVGIADLSSTLTISPISSSIVIGNGVSTEPVGFADTDTLPPILYWSSLLNALRYTDISGNSIIGNGVSAEPTGIADLSSTLTISPISSSIVIGNGISMGRDQDPGSTTSSVIQFWS